MNLSKKEEVLIQKEANQKKPGSESSDQVPVNDQNHIYLDR